jgi:uncharacterized protein (TIGR02722 family)
MHARIWFLALSLVLILSAGCASKDVQVVDTRADAAPRVLGLDYRDFEAAAGDSIAKLIASGVVSKPGGGRYVMVVSRVTNDTMQRIDTEQLTKKIRVELLNSGKVVTTTAVGLDTPEDPMVAKARELRQSKEVKQSTVAGQGTIVAPDLSLSGKIIQMNHRLDKKTQQVEYYFMLSLTDLTTGLAVWENETPIVKRGDAKSVAW